MRTIDRGAHLCASLLAAALLFTGCGIFDNDDDGSGTNGGQTAEFKPLTSPENLVYNLVLSYIELDIEEYARLLLRADEGGYGQEYLWFFQEEDVPAIGAEYWDRQTDIDATNNLFLAAKGMPVEPGQPAIDHLQLEIFTYAPWVEIDSLWGEPCADCWYVKRQYYVSILVEENKIYGADYVELYVVPVQEGDVTTYRIAKALDVRE